MISYFFVRYGNIDSSIQIDGELYYFAGPVVGPNGEKDVPGHVWKLDGPNRILGKHYNTAPEAPCFTYSLQARLPPASMVANYVGF